jgi:hypothetical protein
LVLVTELNSYSSILYHVLYNINAGAVTGRDGRDYLTMKPSSTGNEVWSNSYSGPGTKEDVIRAVEALDYGDFLVAGFSHSTGMDDDIWMLKLDEADGSIIWEKRYGGDGFENSEPSWRQQMA